MIDKRNMGAPKAGRLLLAFVLLNVATLRVFALGDDAAPPQNPFDVISLADGVYAFVWNDPLKDPIESNSFVVVTDRDVLVVDTGIFPSTTRRFAAAVKKITEKPVRYVVNTHWHDDHHNGNFVYRELWPEVEVIAHHRTRDEIFSQTINVRDKDLANMAATAEKYSRWAETGKDDEGKPLIERRRKRAAEIARVNKAGLSEFRTIKETPPDLTITDSLVLHRTYRGKARDIVLRWLGLGNTRGDLVVMIPQERIAATGDLFTNPIPFGIGSYYRDWSATLGRLDSLPVDIMVPGHGPVQRDRAYLRKVRSLLDDLVVRVGEQAAAGAGKDKTVENVTLSDWQKRFAGDDPILQAMFQNVFTAPAVPRAWHQAKGDADMIGE